MDDEDFDRFEKGFRKMAILLRLRLKEAELKELVQAYFRILREARIDVVLEAARVWVTTKTTFPKPAEWLDALAKPTAAQTDAPVLRTMGVEEAAEWSRAEGLRWEDAPCGCFACVSVGISDRPIRFVPQFTPDDRDDRAIHPMKPLPVTTGHWAHGDELARWYRAKEAFYATCDALGLRGVTALIGTSGIAWKVASRLLLCGSCGKAIPTDTRYQAHRIANVPRDLVRCPTCAGERTPGEEG